MKMSEGPLDTFLSLLLFSVSFVTDKGARNLSTPMMLASPPCNVPPPPSAVAAAPPKDTAGRHRAAATQEPQVWL